MNEAAVASVKNSDNYIILTGEITEDIIVSATVCVDLNGKTISGNTFAVVSYDENGETYECAIKPQRASDKAILGMLIKAANA